jgi:hypothetical protein
MIIDCFVALRAPRNDGIVLISIIKRYGLPQPSCLAMTENLFVISIKASKAFF